MYKEYTQTLHTDSPIHTLSHSQILLCAKVYPCLVASAAAYYQPNSFPSYTGITNTAWYFDKVYSNMVREVVVVVVVREVIMMMVRV